MSQTHYRLLTQEGYDALKKGEAYSPNYHPFESEPETTIMDFVRMYPDDWRKIRIRNKKYKPPTWAMVRELEAERDEQKKIAGNFHKHNLKLFDDLVVAKTMCQATAIELDKKSKESDQLRDERDQARMHYERVNEDLTRTVDDLESVKYYRDAAHKAVEQLEAQLTAAEAEIDRLDRGKQLYALAAYGLLIIAAIGWLVAIL